jgi:hypothetical protein
MGLNINTETENRHFSAIVFTCIVVGDVIHIENKVDFVIRCSTADRSQALYSRR